MKVNKIAFACDHAGFATKEFLMEIVKSKGIEIKDYGTYDEESCDYPDFAHPMAAAVEDGEFDLGISLCGSGNGINMVSNKHKGIRSALCWTAEISKLAREHNDANVCSIPARFVSQEEAKDIMEAFINTEFEGGRHQNRVNKIPVTSC